jgi:hypothetical protein
MLVKQKEKCPEELARTKINQPAFPELSNVHNSLEEN